MVLHNHASSCAEERRLPGHLWNGLGPAPPCWVLEVLRTTCPEPGSALKADVALPSLFSASTCPV